MEQKNLLTIELSRLDSEDINLFCKSNEITDVNGFVTLCLRKGYYIEKYGLLNQGTLPDVIEREFEREVKIEDTSKIEELQNEINELKGKLENQKEIECGKLQESLIEMNKRIGEKNETIKDLRNRLQELENMTKSSYAFYLKNSNLTNKL